MDFSQRGQDSIEKEACNHQWCEYRPSCPNAKPWNKKSLVLQLLNIERCLFDLMMKYCRCPSYN
ncbi:hypothetical protein Mapa_016088 [Marchantia paleacea]|nr:hypothetical protein Mapa_016088 [Marchantia paleacea]